MVDERGRVVDRRNALGDGRTALVDGRTALGDGRTAVIDGRTAVVDERTALVDGRNALVDDRLDSSPLPVTLSPNVACVDAGILETDMTWTTPELTEIKMDAEIGAYQPDDFGQDPAFVSRLGLPAERPSVEEPAAAE
jgi:hypothetical protein